ncbi:MAG: hemerythrin family protein [Methylomonas sp.]|jgi:hemerythrin
MTANFIWLDQYKIGNPTIDQQHEYLFDLANEIVDPNNDQQKTYQNILSLYHYVREHFTAEENIMKETNCPGYEAHVKEHGQLVIKLSEITTGIISGETGKEDIMKFMCSWLLQHILKRDILLSECMHKQANNDPHMHQH